jgi:O-antigen ligase
MPLRIGVVIAGTGILLGVAVFQLPLTKALFLLIALAGVALLFANPDWALALFFSSALIKEWLLLNVPFFAQFDFTILIFLISAVALFFFLVRKGYLFEISLHSSMLPLFLFTAFMLFSITYTPSFKYGSAKAFSFLLFNWALFLFPIWLVRKERSASRIITILAVLASVTTAYTLITLMQSLFSGSIIYSYRASFLGVNPISFANWVGAIAILLITYLPNITKRWHRHAAFAAIGLLILALFAANSRGPMISFILSFLLYGAIRFRKTSRRKLLQLALVVLLFVVLALILLPEQLTSRYTDLISKEEGSQNYTYFTINTRLFGWKAALEMGTANFFTVLFGIGNGGFSQAIYRQDIRWYPHNIFIEVFCELGLIGLGLLLWHLGSIWGDIRLFLRKNIPDHSRTLFHSFCMAAFFNFVNAQFSGDLNDNRRFWFFLGMVVALMQAIQDRVPVNDDGSNE